MTNEADVCVVGGGPAGLASAIALRREGMRVIVADCDHPPIDKTCGEGLMPDGVEALSRLGVAIDPRSSYDFRGVRFAGAEAMVGADFPSGRGRGIRRTALHKAMVERAAVAGVEMLWGARVEGLTPGGLLVDGRQISCRWIVGADGRQSRVRRWAGLERFRARGSRFGFRRHYSLPPWSEYMEIHWGEDCQMYVTPVAPGEVCLAIISRNQHLRIGEALRSFPELQCRIADAGGSDMERGALSATCRLQRVTAGRVALVGDASGSVDAITGEGLRLALHQALALAPALAAGNLSEYEAAHRRMLRRPAFMAGLMLSLDRSAWLRRRVLPALAARPPIFENLLAAHVGALSPVEFVRHAALPLGRRLLSA